MKQILPRDRRSPLEEEFYELKENSYLKHWQLQVDPQAAPQARPGQQQAVPEPFINTSPCL